MQWPERWHRGKAEWDILSYYQRFESAIALVLTIVIALIILVALYRLSIGVLTELLFGAADPLEHAVFQSNQDRAADCAVGGGAQVHHSGYA
ncbi:MAG TPA: hypothetical protein VHW69_09125 [Rhizomicrobium sp.]|jgi:hypothetical protein|nr:hypothetical protein [Rhizomicrobium sp.]